MSKEDEKLTVPQLEPQEGPSDEDVFAGGGPAFLDPERSQSIGYVEDDDSTPDFSRWDNEVEPDPDPKHPVLKPRHKEVARLHALGKTNNQISEILGYCRERVSRLLRDPVIKREVDRYRNKLYEKDLTAALKELGYSGLEVIEQQIKSEKEPLTHRVNTAKWLLEKITGKPKQEVSVESNTLTNFMEVIKQMKEEQADLTMPKEVTGQVLDAEYTEETEETVKTGSKFDHQVTKLWDD